MSRVCMVVYFSVVGRWRLWCFFGWYKWVCLLVGGCGSYCVFGYCVFVVEFLWCSVVWFVCSCGFGVWWVWG